MHFSVYIQQYHIFSYLDSEQLILSIYEAFLNLLKALNHLQPNLYLLLKKPYK